LTHSQPLPEDAPAARLLAQDPRLAAPAIRLVAFADPGCEPGGQRDDKPRPAALWLAQPDLLGSPADGLHYVAEADEEGRAVLRFGDGQMGRRPPANLRFIAGYRLGGGPAGNVGAGAITHLVYRLKRPDGIRQVRNPLPAAGGVAPEPISQVKLLAPTAFRRRLERAVTAEDYVAIVMRDFPDEVQRAAATLRWMGSWYEVLLAVDARGRAEADQALLDRIAAHLERYRRAGHDLAVDPARRVSLDVALRVCVRPGFLRGHVKAALLDVFSSRNRRDGRPGYFHPDRLSFGQGIYLSHLVAAAQAVPGVESVTVTRLERRYEGPNGELAAGILPLHPLEVARLDNDPNLPENGLLTLEMRGGR
jgi:predicted phage baseplate assembly protein